MGSIHKVLSEEVLNSGQEAPWRSVGWGVGGAVCMAGVRAEGGGGQEEEDCMKVIILKAEAAPDRRGEDLDLGALQFAA